MTPTALADWLAAIRTAQPTLSVLAVEVVLRVADGIDCTRDLAQAIPGVNRTTIDRTLAQLRGRPRWKQGRWVESPLQLLQSRPHPHVPGALHYSLSPNGQDLIRSLSSGEITELQRCSR